jgi:hypothetical protein
MKHRFPNGAKIIRLRNGSKVPLELGAYKNGVPWQEMSLKEGANYGISLLDGWLLLDFDRDDELRWKESLPATFRVRTRRGEHWYFRYPTSWPKGMGVEYKHPAGELKDKGHGVAPGSVVDGFTYEVLDWNEGEVAEAPQWLLEWRKDGSKGINSDCTTDKKVNKSLDIVNLGEKDQITENRDDFLTAIAGTGRAWGLTERALRGLLTGVAKSGVVKDGSWTGAASQVARIAKSIGSKGAGSLGSDLLTPASLVSGSDIELVGPPHEWWVHSFVPKNELVMLYGAGGIGKSTFARWLAVQVVAREGNFLHIGIEEPFRRFLWGCVLSGLQDRSRMHSLRNASRFKLPHDLGSLRELIEECCADFVYFDSIKTHLDGREGMTSPERDRVCLGPLAELAQELGVTILCNFHENKTGEYSGSTELKDVARYMLHAKRKGQGPLTVTVKKTNLKEPNYRLTFDGVEVPMVDPITGEAELDVLETGEVVTDSIIVAVRGENRPLAPDTEEMPIGDTPPPL